MPFNGKCAYCAKTEMMTQSVDLFCLLRSFSDNLFVCFFDLILNVPSTIFQLNRDGSSWVEPVLKFVFLKDHNAVTSVRLEPAAPRSRVKHSTTEPLRSLFSDKS